jgi:hypothetical protein
MQKPSDSAGRAVKTFNTWTPFWALSLLMGASAFAGLPHEPSPAEKRLAQELRLKYDSQDQLKAIVAACPARARAVCSDLPTLRRRAYADAHERTLSFENYSTPTAPSGVCWGYAKMQRRLLAFAHFDAPGAAAPQTKRQARRRLLPILWGVPTIVPGVSSIKQLSAHPVYARALRDIITQAWVDEFYRPSNLGWALKIRSPKDNLKALGELGERLDRDERPLLVIQFTTGLQHVVLAERLVETTDGFEMQVIDSNFVGLPQRFFFDKTGEYRADRSHNFYFRHKSRLGLKVVERHEDKVDNIGLQAACCLESR